MIHLLHAINAMHVEKAKWNPKSQNGVSLAENFRYKGSSPTDHSSCQKTRQIDLLGGIRILAVDYSVLSQCTCSTDEEMSTARPCICILSHMVRTEN